VADLITADVFVNPWDAHIVKGLLESEGIVVYIMNEHHIGANWMMSNALGGVKLQVVNENASLAIEILDSMNKGEYEGALKEEFPSTQLNICPECGSKGFKSKFSIRTTTLLLCTVFLASVFFPPRREYHTCLECGRKWRY